MAYEVRREYSAYMTLATLTRHGKGIKPRSTRETGVGTPEQNGGRGGTVGRDRAIEEVLACGGDG